VRETLSGYRPQEMGRPFYQAIEKVVHASGKLAEEGLKLVFKEGEGREVHASVEDFDKETKVFLICEHGEGESKSRIVSPRVFKVGMLASLPSAKTGKFLAAWNEHVEPLLQGAPRRRKPAPHVREEGDAQSMLGRGHKEKECPRKSPSEKSLHSAASLGRKRSAFGDFRTPEEGEIWRHASHAKSRKSEQGETSEAHAKVRKKKRSGSQFQFPVGVKTMEDFVAYLQPKLGQLPSNPVLVADVERRYANVDQTKKGLYQTTDLLIRVYKAPQEWQRVLLSGLVYGMFMVNIKGLFGYQQDALLTNTEAIRRKAGPPGSITPQKLEEMETQVCEAFEKRFEKITEAVSKGKLPVSTKSK
jgi:hypothetical protein